jgi:hypothetical protein
VTAVAEPLDDLTLGEIRHILTRMVAQADSSERPKPDVINPPGHSMPGHEWRITQTVLTGRPPVWLVRTVDDSEVCDSVYIAQPYPENRYDWLDKLDFTPMEPHEARRFAMAILAAADRAEHQAAGVTRLEDRRRRT